MISRKNTLTSGKLDALVGSDLRADRQAQVRLAMERKSFQQTAIASKSGKDTVADLAAEWVALVQKDPSRDSGNWCSQPCADLVEFLAYSGCRISEAKHVKWEDVTDTGIWIHGGEEGTKNRQRRLVPIIPVMRVLLDDLIQNPRIPIPGRDGYVLEVTSCSETIQKACKKIGIKPITHHTLRHLFVTRCIESGVDVPTVAEFAGHKDRGVLIMKTYSHLLQSHAQAMTAKVSF